MLVGAVSRAMRQELDDARLSEKLDAKPEHRGRKPSHSTLALRCHQLRTANTRAHARPKAERFAKQTLEKWDRAPAALRKALLSLLPVLDEDVRAQVYERCLYDGLDEVRASAVEEVCRDPRTEWAVAQLKTSMEAANGPSAAVRYAISEHGWKVGSPDVVPLLVSLVRQHGDISALLSIARHPSSEAAAAFRGLLFEPGTASGDDWTGVDFFLCAMSCVPWSAALLNDLASPERRRAQAAAGARAYLEAQVSSEAQDLPDRGGRLLGALEREPSDGRLAAAIDFFRNEPGKVAAAIADRIEGIEAAHRSDWWSGILQRHAAPGLESLIARSLSASAALLALSQIDTAEARAHAATIERDHIATIAGMFPVSLVSELPPAKALELAEKMAELVPPSELWKVFEALGERCAGEPGFDRVFERALESAGFPPSELELGHSSCALNRAFTAAQLEALMSKATSLDQKRDLCLVAWFGNRREAVPRILEYAREADPGSDLAVIAALVVGALADGPAPGRALADLSKTRGRGAVPEVEEMVGLALTATDPAEALSALIARPIPHHLEFGMRLALVMNCATRLSDEDLLRILQDLKERSEFFLRGPGEQAELFANRVASRGTQSWRRRAFECLANLNLPVPPGDKVRRDLPIDALKRYMSFRDVSELKGPAVVDALFHVLTDPGSGDYVRGEAAAALRRAFDFDVIPRGLLPSEAVSSREPVPSAVRRGW